MSDAPQKRGRGRPKGAKNKPKPPVIIEVPAPTPVAPTPVEPAAPPKVPKQKRVITATQMKREMSDFGMSVSDNAKIKLINMINDHVDKNKMYLSMMLTAYRGQKVVDLPTVDLVELMSSVDKGKVDAKQALSSMFE